MIVRNGNMYGILLIALVTIWHLSLGLTLSEEQNATTKIAIYSNLSTEPNAKDEIKPYPRNLVKPFPKIVASKIHPTAKRRKSTRTERNLISIVPKKSKHDIKRTKRKSTTRKVNRGRHRKKASKRKNHKKSTKHKPRLTTTKKIIKSTATKTMTTNGIYTKISPGADYYYEEYYIDVASTRPNTRMVSHETTAMLGKRRILKNNDAVTTFDDSNEQTWTSATEEVPRLIEYESFGRIKSGVSPRTMARLHKNLMLTRCLARFLDNATLLKEMSYKMNPQLKILRHLLSELRHASSSGKLSDSQMTDYIFFQYRNFKATTMKTCRAKEEVTCLVNTYVTYLQSIRKYKELLKTYQKMRERSIEEAAKMIGYKLPHDPEPYLKP